MTVSASTVSDKAANISVQTDEFLVSPYEHLFPFILPQWNSNNDKVPVSKESNNLGGRAHDHSENPYDILDHYVQAAYKTTKTGSATNKSSPEQEIKQLKVVYAKGTVSLISVISNLFLYSALLVIMEQIYIILAQWRI